MVPKKKRERIKMKKRDQYGKKGLNYKKEKMMRKTKIKENQRTNKKKVFFCANKKGLKDKKVHDRKKTKKD